LFSRRIGRWQFSVQSGYGWKECRCCVYRASSAC